MQYGIMIGDSVVALTDMAHGRPIVESAAPYVREGYHVEERWSDDGMTISHVYSVVPDEGTAQEAALALARMQFQSLPDEAAHALRALAPEWVAGASYEASQMVLVRGELYRCLRAHVSQAGWEPGAAPSLWARVLPGQQGTEPGEWEQPADATTAYAKGDRVTHGGKVWESTVGANVWEPGADGVTQWVEVVA